MDIYDDDDDCPMAFPRFESRSRLFDDDGDHEPDEWTDEELMSLKPTSDLKIAGVRLHPEPASQQVILLGSRRPSMRARR